MKTCFVGRDIAFVAPCVLAFLHSENKAMIQKNKAAAAIVVELVTDFFFSIIKMLGVPLLNSRSKTPLSLKSI